jgi:hypothetical protein
VSALGRRIGRSGFRFSGPQRALLERKYEVEAENVATFFDSYAFELGGRRFEHYATPDGESLDSLIVWIPPDRSVFIGNFLGPMFGQVPNLHTVRRDKIRRAIPFNVSMLIPGMFATEGTAGELI